MTSKQESEPTTTEISREEGKPSFKEKVLETASSMLQSFQPIKQIKNHLCAWHFYNGRSFDENVMAHHYCSHLAEGIHQCVIYDSNKSDAKLIGVEYIISEKLFSTLDEQEKLYWHSHQYEVSAGLLVQPGVPLIGEKQLMKELVNTYGKTWHVWQVDKGHKLPLGPAQLMMSYTQDGQLPTRCLEEREVTMGVSTEEIKENRSDLNVHPVLPGANAWMEGRAIQVSMVSPTQPLQPIPPSSSSSSSSSSTIHVPVITTTPPTAGLPEQ